MDNAPSIARRLQQRWTRLAERLFGEAAGTETETSRGEFTSAFMSDRNLADYVARENARRNALRPPGP